MERFFHLIKIHGFRWKNISASMDPWATSNNRNCRPEMNLKNKFHGEVRKILRTLNRLTMRVLKKRIKPLKEKSLLRAFYIVEDGTGWGEEVQQLAWQLRETLFRLMLTSKNNDLPNLDEIIKQIEEFNLKTKHYAIFRKKTPTPIAGSIGME